MSLCATCVSLDIPNLLTICLLQCRERQDAVSDGRIHDNNLTNYEKAEAKHHSDIFELQKSSKDCGLCKIIFQAFKRTNVRDLEVARGLQIIVRVSYNKIGVYYDTNTKEELVRLCGLDLYMYESDVNKLFRGLIKEDNSPPILKRMEKNPGADKSLRTALGWLDNCVENHTSCRTSRELHKPPRRLLHVGSATQNPFLIENTSGTSETQHLEWISLSYCWGEEPSMKLTNQSMDMLKNGIPLDKFDDAIQDAISVTRGLKVSYIWVDALCILQDGSEWKEEASNMNEIYGGSIVTLVAASCDSVRKGFLKDRDLNYIPVAYSTDLKGNRTARIFLAPEWDENDQESNGAWSRRGWTMQEGLLPNRLLQYTASQIIWKCCEQERYERGVTESVHDRMSEVLTYSDAGDMGFDSGFLWGLPAFSKFKGFKDYVPTSLDYPLMSHPHAYRLWYDLVEDYTPRSFTILSDRLVAISSLARVYGEMIRNPTYVAGLWKEDLIKGLLWHVEGTTLDYERPTNNTSTFLRKFPSWRWASVGYEAVKYDFKAEDNLRPVANIENVEIDLAHPRDPFGSVKGGRITISGPLKRLPRLYNNKWTMEQEAMSELERHISKIIENESSRCVTEICASPQGDHSSVLLMARDLGICSSLLLLVLEATGEIRNANNVYRRVGLLQLRRINAPPSFFASPELIAAVEREDSIAMQLGLGPRIYKTRNASDAAFPEVGRENWAKTTVMIA